MPQSYSHAYDIYFTLFHTHMKKNLFLLFSLYFFVVQPMFVWILRQETNMLILGLINLIAIFIILLVYKAIDSQSDKPHKDEPKKAHIQEERETIATPHHHEAVVKKSSKKSGTRK